MNAMINIRVIVTTEIHDEALNKPVTPEDVKFGGAAGRYVSQ